MWGDTLGERFRRHGYRRRDHEVREVRRTLELATEDRRKAPRGEDPDRDRVIDLAEIERERRRPLFPPARER